MLRPPKAILTAIIAALGPIAWITHNALTHGDPFRFAARVSAYQKAVGGTVDALAYPLSLFREEPELATLAAALALATLIRRRRARPHTAKPPAWRRTLPRATLLLATMLAALSFAALRGGAPTHHAGRAVLALWLAAALYVAPAIRAALRGPHRRPFALFVATLMPLGALILRPWYSRLDDFTPRHDEVAIGRAAAALAAPSDRILIISPDYRHFAIQAATARPWTVIADRDHARGDPSNDEKHNMVVVAARRGDTATRLGPPATATIQWAAWTPSALTQ